MYRFKVRVNGVDHEYLLDVYDMRVLVAMSEQHKNQEKITVAGIAEKCDVAYDSANDTIKKLRKLKLVSAVGFNLGIQVRGRRKFTPLGVAVVMAHEAGIYGRPLSEPQSPLEIIEKANERLI
jgi:hypothetical protein